MKPQKKIFPDETKKMQERMKSNRKYKCVGENNVGIKQKKN